MESIIAELAGRMFAQVVIAGLAQLKIMNSNGARLPEQRRRTFLN